MKKLTLSVIATAFMLVAPASNAALLTYNWFTDANFESPSFIQFFKSDGSTKLDDTYTVELGVMSAPVTTALSVANNFQSLNISTNWDPNIMGAGLGGATVSFSYDTALTSSFPNGITSTVASPSNITAWIYNSKSISTSSQWVIVSNTNWILTPLTTLTDTSKDFTITDAGTT